MLGEMRSSIWTPVGAPNRSVVRRDTLTLLTAICFEAFPTAFVDTTSQGSSRLGDAELTRRPTDHVVSVRLSESVAIGLLSAGLLPRCVALLESEDEVEVDNAGTCVSFLASCLDRVRVRSSILLHAATA